MRKYSIFYYLLMLIFSMLTFSGCGKRNDYIDELSKEYKGGLAVNFGIVNDIPDNGSSNEYNCNEYNEISDKMSEFAKEINSRGYDNLTDKVQSEFKKLGYELFTGSKDSYMRFFESENIGTNGYEYVRVGNIIAISEKSSGKLCADCFYVLLSQNYEFMDLVKKYGLTALAEQIRKADDRIINEYESGRITANSITYDYYGTIIEYYMAGLVIETREYGDQEYEPYYILKGLDYLFNYYADDVWSLRNVFDQEKGSIMDVIKMYNSVQINSQNYEKYLNIYGKDNRIYEVVVNGNVAGEDEPVLGIGETDTFRNLLIGMGNSETEADDFIKNVLSRTQDSSGTTGELEYTLTTDSPVSTNTDFELRVYVTK